MINFFILSITERKQSKINYLLLPLQLLLQSRPLSFRFQHQAQNRTNRRTLIFSLITTEATQLHNHLRFSCHLSRMLDSKTDFAMPYSSSQQEYDQEYAIIAFFK